MDASDVIAAWDQAGPMHIHPSRAVSEDAYWQTGDRQAEAIAAVLPAKATVVDFGCGDGRIAIPLSRRGFNVTAVDGSPTMLAALAENDPSLKCISSDGSDLRAKLPRKVDAVVCLSVLIHHDYPSTTKLIGALRRVVKANGLMVIDWPTSEQPSERQTFTEVTTWDRTHQDALADALGLERINSGLDWPTFRVHA